MSDPNPEMIRRAEAELAASSRRLRLYEAVLSSTPDLIYIFDRDHRFIYANQALLSMWGKSWEEARERTCLELGYEPWHAAMHDREIEQVVATRLPVRGEVPFAGTNGRRIYDYIFVPVIGADGHVEAVAGTTRDVTERQGMEAALRSSEEFNRAILENSPDCMKVLDFEGKLERMNLPGLCMMEIDDFADFLGLEWPMLWPDEARPEVAAAIVAARDGKTVRFQAFCPTAKGTPKWWDVIVTPIRDDEGKVWRILSVSRDVTANKAAEQQLAAAKAAAEAASKAKDDFLAALSHELRTPLNPVLMTAVEGERDEELSPAVRASFGMIRRNVELEARLIDDLLDLTRISRGKLRLVRQVLDVHELLHACVRFVSPEIEAKGLKLALVLEAAKRWVEADPVRLQQVFWNVLRNAVKFTPHNGTVTVRTRAHNGTVVVEVQDNGIGIAATELTTIFEAFRQGGEGGQFGGLGLGLAITRALVEQHGGRIAAESDGEGLGSTFRLEFPHAAAPTAEQPAADSKAVERGRAGSSGRRILLVEDHEDTRETLQRLLVRRGHQVSPAGSLRGARALAETGEFDFVITDLGLPDGDGTELLGAFSRTAQPPIGIALTGYGMEDDIQRTLAAGFSAHLTKPIDFTELDRLLSGKC
jgi:PAS domain S-box-containing protein